MAETKSRLEKQEVKRGVRIGIDLKPKPVPVILLRNENVPVAVVFNVLRRAQQQSRNSRGKSGENKTSAEHAGSAQCQRLPFRAPGQKTVYTWDAGRETAALSDAPFYSC